MANVVGSVGTGKTAYNTVASPELAQLQKELSQSVDGEAAKTSRGQAQIDRLSARIATLQGQQQAEQAIAPPKPAPAPAPERPREGPLGTQLDTYA